MSCSQMLLECGLNLGSENREGWLGMSNSRGSGRKTAVALMLLGRDGIDVKVRVREGPHHWLLRSVWGR